MEKIQIGVYDDPKNQKQAMLELDLLNSNIVVFGTAMSGKTTFIKTLLVRMHEKYTPKTENVYIVDFSGALIKYRNLKFVCGCFDNSNEENIKRLFNKLENILSRNTKMLGGTPYREYSKDDKIAHTTFIINNFNGFLADRRYDAYQERLMKLCREGLSKGITVILTVADTSGGVNSYITNFGQKIAFEMVADKLTEVFGTKVMVPISLPGRGLTNISNQIYEFQCFLPFKVKNPLRYNEEEETEFEAFRKIIDSKYSGVDIEKLGSFDGKLTSSNFHDFASNGQTINEANHTASNEKAHPVTVGLDYYDMNPVTLDLEKTAAIAIYGKKQSGKTNLLWLLVEEIVKRYKGKSIRFVLLDDGRKQLVDIANYIERKQFAVNNIPKITDFWPFLFEKGYYDTTLRYDDIDDSKPFALSENPFTVFILQSRALYTGKGDKWNEYIFPEMVSDARNKWMFILSDVQNINDNYARNAFNDSLSVAFLLRDIAEYVNDKGSKTVFGGMDVKELREQYARIEQGDGYYYDIDSDHLEKLKFIYSDELRKIESKGASNYGKQ